MKKLLIRADDIGYSEAVTAGILICSGVRTCKEQQG